jgi:RNA polymerase sigma-70 factor (ECF subfamily)
MQSVDVNDTYARFRPFVYNLARRISRDRMGAEDVTQEVFLQLWTDPGRFDPELGSMRAWLGTMTHRTAVAWVRRQVATRRRDEKAALLATASDTDGDVEGTVVRLGVAERVRAAVAALPHPQRRVVELAYLHGLTFRQVAEHLGVPEGTAKSRLRLGLRRLHRQLA